MELSRTQRALAYLRDHPEMTVYAVALMHDITPTTLYTTLKRERDSANKNRCQCCGQVVRQGFVIDHAKTADAERARIVAALRAKGETTATCSAMADAIEKMA